MQKDWQLCKSFCGWLDPMLVSLSLVSSRQAGKVGVVVGALVALDIAFDVVVLVVVAPNSIAGIKY